MNAKNEIPVYQFYPTLLPWESVLMETISSKRIKQPLHQYDAIADVSQDQNGDILLFGRVIDLSQSLPSSNTHNSEFTQKDYLFSSENTGETWTLPRECVVLFEKNINVGADDLKVKR